MRVERVAIIFIAVFLALDTVAGTHIHAMKKQRPREQNRKKNPLLYCSLEFLESAEP